jgi:hypothetical protein
VRFALLLLVVSACTISAGGGPPEPVHITSFDAAAEQVSVGADVLLSWKLSGPVVKLVLAIGDCAVDLDPSDTSFTDRCGGTGASCACGSAAAGDVLYTLTALGTDDDETADTATRAIHVAAP